MAMYRVVVYKNQLGIGGKPWDNTYEVVTNASIAPIPDLTVVPQERLLLLRLAGAIAAYEQRIHLSTTYFNRVGVSTYEEDSETYNGDELVTLPLSTNGLRTIPGGEEALGLDDTLFVRRQPQLGQLGKIMYRGVLLKDDSVVSAQGLKTLNPSSPVSNGGSLWGDAVAEIAEGLMDWKEQGADEWAFAMIHQPTSETVVARPLVTFVPAGIVPLKLNKKHYNKGSAKQAEKIAELENKLAAMKLQLATSE